MSCTVMPLSAFQSTNLNNKIDSYSRLADRIVRMLGAPVVSVEVHQDQIFEAISIACEMFTKYAGFTREYIVFDSTLYQRYTGLRLDHLFTLANTKLSLSEKAQGITTSRTTSTYLDTPTTAYIASSAISSSLTVQVPELSAAFVTGIKLNQIFDKDTYTQILTAFANTPSVSSTPVESIFTQSYIQPASEKETPAFNNMFDYDLMDYRKVVDITDFEEGSSSGINTLFTIEQTLAQQTYFSYAMGNYGFDLISWYAVKEWLECREKMLATRKQVEFDPRTQYLRMYPEPTPNQIFYGVLACYVERPLRDIIKETWVFQYSLALTKMMVGNVRTKIPVSMFGGQTFSGDFAAQGLQEKQALEEQLYQGLGSASVQPPIFLVG